MSTSTRPSTAIRPASGRPSPAIRLTSEVFPDPDGPKSAVSRPALSKAASSVKPPEPLADVHRQRHPRSMLRLIRRAKTSEATSAAMATAIDTSVSRSAPSSPPGTWVKV